MEIKAYTKTESDHYYRKMCGHHAPVLHWIGLCCGHHCKICRYEAWELRRKAKSLTPLLSHKLSTVVEVSPYLKYTLNTYLLSSKENRHLVVTDIEITIYSDVGTLLQRRQVLTNELFTT